MMSEKRFRVRFEQEDGRGEIVNEKGVELTAREVVDLLNDLNDKNEELNEQVNNYHATFQSLLKTKLSLNNQLAETQKELKELYESLFPKPDLEHLNCRCSYEPIE